MDNRCLYSSNKLQGENRVSKHLFFSTASLSSLIWHSVLFFGCRVAFFLFSVDIINNVEVRALGRPVHDWYRSTVCFSMQGFLHCIGGVFGVIVMLKNKVVVIWWVCMRDQNLTAIQVWWDPRFHWLQCSSKTLQTADTVFILASSIFIVEDLNPKFLI